MERKLIDFKQSRLNSVKEGNSEIVNVLNAILIVLEEINEEMKKSVII